MDEVVKGVRRDERVRAEMKGGRDPGGDVAGHGPVGPGEGGPREKAMGGCKGAEHECEGRVAKVNRASPWRRQVGDAADLMRYEMWRCGG